MTESPIAVSEGVDTNRNERTISSEDGQLETATELSEDGADEYVLVLRHCHLVDYDGYITESVLDELDVPYDTADHEWLPELDLDQYTTIVIPAVQSHDYYDEVIEEREKLASFVDDGGTLVGRVADVTPDEDDEEYCTGHWTTSFLPDGVSKVDSYRDDLAQLEPDHPVVDGVSDDDLYIEHWHGSTAGYLTGLPDDATTIVGIDGDEDRPTYAEYDYGDGHVLATMQPLEFHWSDLSDTGTEDLVWNELEYVLDLEDDGDVEDEVTASVTTLQFIPGQEENPSKGGHPLNSGLMQMFPEDDQWGVWGRPVEVAADSVMDSWLGGDMTDELPDDLEDARQPVQGKYSDDAGAAAFNEYRFENGVSVSFETSDGGSIDTDTVEIEFSERGPSGDDPIVSRGEQENSMTVLHRHDLNGIPFDDWYGTNEQRSIGERRYYRYNTEFEFDGVEGVRVTTIRGGVAGFMQDISERVSTDAPGFVSDVWDWGTLGETAARLALMSAPQRVEFFLNASTAVPRTWTFIDFIVLADGRRYARVWDASQYPSLYTYVDGTRRDEDDMDYEPKQLWNRAMLAFHMRASAGATPYNIAPLTQFQAMLRTGPDADLWNQYRERIEETLEALEIGWSASELLPTMPRVTVGLNADDEPIDDPDAPFPPAEALIVPVADTLPPN